MAWVTLTETDLRKELTEGESDQLDEINVGEIEDALTRAIEQVRDAVRSGLAALNQTTGMGSDGTVAPGLARATLAIARYDLLAKLPLDELITKHRERAYEEARELLELVASGKRLVEGMTARAVSVPSVDDPSLSFEEDDEDGI